MATTYYCEKCGRVLRRDQFYMSNNLEKYPNDGVFNMCKKCLTMHVDNWDPSTYLWILEEADVPYVPEEWQKLLVKFGKGDNVTGATIVGRYLGKMKLKQYKDYRWKDNEFLQELRENKIKQTMQRQGYDSSEIAQAIEKGRVDLEAPPPPKKQENNSDNVFDPFEEEDDDFANQLTDEDKTYLRLKWGKLYKPEEWIRLEQLYNDMMNSYDIQEAGHIDTLKLICKTSLKANQLIDLGDIEGYQKMSKVYNELMKAGKFTAAQNKNESGEAVDSISELVAMCEADGFIPRYYVDTPMDKVDRVLEDLQRYTRTLVMEEMGLGNLIENAVKQIQQDSLKEQQDDDDIDENEEFEEELFTYDEDTTLTDEDFAELSEMQEQLEKDNEDFFNSLTEGRS